LPRRHASRYTAETANLADVKKAGRTGAADAAPRRGVPQGDPMRLRRCAVVAFEARARPQVRPKPRARRARGPFTPSEWGALAPHPREGDVGVSAEEFAVLGKLSPSQWTALEALAQAHASDLLESLLAKTLLVAEDSEADARDRRVRETHWRSTAATA